MPRRERCAVALATASRRSWSRSRRTRSIGGYAGRKAALRAQVAGAGEHALMLFAADKAARVHELRVTDAATPQRRLAHYRSSLRMLEERLPDSTLTARLRDELARLGRRRRRPAAAG